MNRYFIIAGMLLALLVSGHSHAKDNDEKDNEKTFKELSESKTKAYEREVKFEFDENRFKNYGQYVSSEHSHDVQVSTVPEPVSSTLFLAGLLVVSGIGRARSRR